MHSVPEANSQKSQPKGGLATQLECNNFSISEAVGGPLGVVEAALPTVAFIALYSWQGLFRAGVAAVLLSLCFTLFRLLRRQPVKHSLSGLFLVFLGAAWAYKSNSAGNFFALGFWINGIWGSAFLVSALIKQPIIGWIGAIFAGANQLWKLPEFRDYYRSSIWSTCFFVFLFAARLLVELPLYYGGYLVALGVARLALGLPAFAIAGFFTWRLLANPYKSLKQAALAHRAPGAEAK